MKQKPKEIDTLKIRELYVSGMTADEIAETLGMENSKVIYELEYLGYKPIIKKDTPNLDKGYSLLTGGIIRQVLCAAAINRVLIITKTNSDARAIRHEISDFVRIYLSPRIYNKIHSEGVNIGGYEPIFVYDLKKWNDCYRCYPFRGVVMVTDKNISDIKNIAEGTKKWLLQVEVKK